MREIIFDTETTGLDQMQDRIIEIGAVELDNRFPTGRSFHVYINPQGREVHPEAHAVHGISNAFLADKPVFSQIVGDFLAFTDGARLIAHNASFDVGFLNAEFRRCALPPVDEMRVTDSLLLARRRHPMGPNSLDALCKRYGIDNSHRTKHGALLDSELLAEVYIELVGGRQAALGFVQAGASGAAVETVAVDLVIPPRPRALAPRLTVAERESHAAMVAGLGDNAVWKRYTS